MLPILSEQVMVDELYEKFFEDLANSGFKGDIETDYSSRLAVATDNSVYQWVPQGVVFPRCTNDVALIMQLGNSSSYLDIKFSPRGGGTGTNGQSLNNGVVVDLSRHLNVILDYNQKDHSVRVQPGVVKDQLNSYLKSSGYFFAPELSTSNRATIGGMISTDASGQGSLVYGKTSQHVKSVTLVLFDGSIVEFYRVKGNELQEKLSLKTLEGEIYRTVYDIVKNKRKEIEDTFPKLTRFLTGYDLKNAYDPEDDSLDISRLICGGEGTLAFIVEAKLDLTKIPKYRALVNVKYDSFDSALRNARVMVSSGCLSVETVDSKVLNLAKTDIIWYSVKDLITEVDGFDMQGINIVEFAGDDESLIKEKITKLCERLDLQIKNQDGGIIGYQFTYDLNSILNIYAMRKKAVGLLGKAQGDAKPIAFTEDTCVPPENLADYILEFRALLDSHNLTYGMFGHVDSGVLHVRPALDMCDPEQEQKLHEITAKMVDLTAKYGGLMWGEHGRGFRSQYGPKYFGELFIELRKIKEVFDPRNIINPGKICTPLNSTDELVQVSAQKRGYFDRQIPLDDRHSFDEVMVCNGNGACFNYDVNSPMCPSYKVFRDRRYSPKGRASLAREWLRKLKNVNFDIKEAEELSLSLSPIEFVTKLKNTLLKKFGKYDFSNEVMDSLLECLACKACSSQCPVKVDIANFRSRFLYQYHKTYLRPVKDYCVATIESTLPLMARLPRTVNLMLQNPLSNFVSKTALGIVDLPALSYPTLYTMMKELNLPTFSLERLQHLPIDQRSKCVLIVQDPFTSFYDADVVRDLLVVIKKLGYIPYVLPFKPNGKAQHVRGFLGMFANTAKNTADFLNEIAKLGIPMVGADPAMVICYRDEYKKILGSSRGDFNVMLMQEWLLNHIKEAEEKPNLNKISETYYLLAHCQEKTFKPSTHNDWISICNYFDLSVKAVAVGCCGMAGMYGHEKVHEDTSRKIYQQSFGIAIKKYGVDNCLVTGYSCRSQVKRQEGKKVKHPIQLIAKAIL